MQSWLLDASMELVHSYDEGDTRNYTVILKFKDLFGNDQRYFATIDFSKFQALNTRVSFTAMSSVNIRLGLIESITDLTIRIMLNDSMIDIANRHMFSINAGQLVYLVEHLDVASGDNTLCEVVIPYDLSFSPEVLCLQTINADLMDDAGNLLYRLSADSLPGGGCYGTRVET